MNLNGIFYGAFYGEQMVWCVQFKIVIIYWPLYKSFLRKRLLVGAVVVLVLTLIANLDKSRFKTLIKKWKYNRYQRVQTSWNDLYHHLIGITRFWIRKSNRKCFNRRRKYWVNVPRESWPNTESIKDAFTDWLCLSHDENLIRIPMSISC